MSVLQPRFSVLALDSLERAVAVAMGVVRMMLAMQFRLAFVSSVKSEMSCERS